MNTYSNIGMFVVGALLLYTGSREPDQARGKVDRDVGLIAFVIGISSAIAHATQLRFGSMMDYVSQFLLFAYVLAINTHRLWKWGAPTRRFLIVGLVFVTWLICLIEKHLGLAVFGVLSGLFLISEYLSLRKGPAPDRGALVKSLALLGVGLVCFTLDAEKIGCYPEEHWLQLHSAWHLLAAGSIFYTAKYYKQFSIDNH